MESIVERVREVLDRVGLMAGDCLVVAVSGGVDSMVLLDVLDRLRGEWDCQLYLAHLDHGLRDESSADSDFVAAVASQRRLRSSVERRNVRAFAKNEGLSLEEAGRRLRYDFFDVVAQRAEASFIALGHHADDQAETVILRLLRGSGTTGLGAMEAVREGRYLRPLLGVQRAEIECYARERGLEYRVDSTNCDRRFLRNRVRWELFPLLKEYNPNIAGVLNRTAGLLKDEDHLLTELAEEALSAVVCERSKDKIALERTGFLDYHIAMQRRVVRAVLQGLRSADGPFDFARVEQILGWIRDGDKHLRDLGDGVRGQGSGPRYILRRGYRSPLECWIELPGVVVLAEYGVELCTEFVSGEEFARIRGVLGGRRVAFDADRLGERVQLRSPRKGDRFQPLGMEGHKKLSHFLIDVKWPKIMRDEVLVLAREEEIAWVAPLRSSHTFRVDSSTRRILLCELRQRSDHGA